MMSRSVHSASTGIAAATSNEIRSAASQVSLSVCLFSIALVLLGLHFWTRNVAAGIPSHPYRGNNALGGIAFAMLGALVTARRPEHPIGRMFCAVALTSGVTVFSGEYGPYATLGVPDVLPGGIWSSWLGNWFWWLVFLPMLWVLMVFPTGQVSSRWWWLAVIAGTVGIVGAALGDALMPGPLRLLPGTNPLGITGAMGVLETFRRGGGLLVVSAGMAGVVGLLVRLRGSRGVERQQLKWFAYAVGIATALLPTGIAVDGVIGVRVVGPIVGFGFSVLVPAAITIAVLRYRLWDIDILINRTLVYVTLTVGLIAIYALAVTALGTLFHTSGNYAISLVAAGFVAVVFQPLRVRLQSGVSRLLYGDRDEPYKVLDRMGRLLEASLAHNAVLPTIVHTLTEALKLPYAAIIFAQSDGVAAASGTPVAAAIRMPLLYHGETVGELLIAPRASGEELNPADIRLLDSLARQIGMAVHAVRLTSRLQEARERLVAAREEERRRLRRDLHDGLGPVLASQALTLSTARKLVSRDPDAAVALLDELMEQTRESVADIRRLVYALRPPALDDLGLLSALREQCLQYEQGGLRITIDTPDVLPPLPAAIEVATYRIVQEALTNVERHAAAQSCRVAVMFSAVGGRTSLQVDVCDDGRGRPLGTRTGVGTASMRERAEELGGTCVIESAPDRGTVVRAWLPLPEEVPWTPSAS